MFKKFKSNKENKKRQSKKNSNKFDDTVSNFEQQNEIYDSVSGKINTNNSFNQHELISNNLSYDALYTREDLVLFNLSEQDVSKFFKNGSVFYKLKKPINQDNGKAIFKKDTKFSLQTIGELSENDPLFKDVKHHKEFDIDSILNIRDGVNDKLKQQIYNLNKELENNLNKIEQYTIRDDEFENIANTHRMILQQQKEIREKIYSLKDDYANSSVFYRIQNLSFSTWNEDDIYFGYKISNMSFDIYSGDRIVILSDNSITNQLLIDVLRGDEVKTGGYIYKNLTRSQKWVDVENADYDQYKIQAMNLDEEIYYGLTSPDYISFGSSKKDVVATALKKILNKLPSAVSNDFKNKLIKLMKFNNCMSLHVFDLDDLNLEKFITICDILIGKKIILMKSICQGMNYNEKINLFRFLNKYFESKKITVLYASDDYLEANLVATKVMIIKDGHMIENKKINYILNQFETIDDYILYTLKYGLTPNSSE